MRLTGRQLKALMTITHSSYNDLAKDAIFIFDDAVYFTNGYSIIKITLAHNLDYPSTPDGMAACTVQDQIIYKIPPSKIRVNDNWEITSTELRQMDKNFKIVKTFEPYDERDSNFTQENFNDMIKGESLPGFVPNIECRINPEIMSDCMAALNQICGSITINCNNLWITGHSWGSAPRGDIEKVDFCIAGMRKG